MRLVIDGGAADGTIGVVGDPADGDPWQTLLVEWAPDSPRGPDRVSAWEVW